MPEISLARIHFQLLGTEAAAARPCSLIMRVSQGRVVVVGACLSRIDWVPLWHLTQVA